MFATAIWTAFVLAYSSYPFVLGIPYIDPISMKSAQPGSISDIVEKRVDLTEPSCEELRAMWRYTKRQSRAAKTTTGYPLYPDPFSYNAWQSYSDRGNKPSHSYRGSFTGRARSRAAGGAPIYGRMIHKAPAGSRLRNGMRHRSRTFEDLAQLYGTINRYPTSNRRRLTNFRVGGGGGGGVGDVGGPGGPGGPGGGGGGGGGDSADDGTSTISQPPQAGSFKLLMDLIRAERARELQEQHMVEEAVAAKTTSFKDSVNTEDRGPSVQQSRKQYLRPLLSIQNPNKFGYEYGQGRYTSNLPNYGQAWSRSEPQNREYMLR